MKRGLWRYASAFVLAAGTLSCAFAAADDRTVALGRDAPAKARNVVFFVGDGMGVSTVTAARIYAVGVDGELTIDTFPYTAMSRTYTSDYITPDSAGTMSAMMTGVNTNSGIIGYDAATEVNDFNKDGDGERPWTLLEMAKRAGMKVGVVSTTKITHATPAACYAHVNDRGKENDIASQALPTDANYNTRLGKGVDLLIGGGRRHFIAKNIEDEEGEFGRRNDPDDRDLRKEFQNAGYKYVWSTTGFEDVTPADLPLLALFESGHMEYEYDRPKDLGGEPSIVDMTAKSIRLLEKASQGQDRGYFLMVESGRIDHAHHIANAQRSMIETVTFDNAIATAVKMVDLKNTLIIVTADHSHVFALAGYPLVDADRLPYKVNQAPSDFRERKHHGALDVVYSLNTRTGEVYTATDVNGVPYTMPGYLNGPGYRANHRIDPRFDPFEGLDQEKPAGPADIDYRQEAACPLRSESHGAEDVVIYGMGAGAERIHGTVKNTYVFEVMRIALGL